MNTLTFVHTVEGYTLSRDYQRLLKLMRKASVVCLVDYDRRSDGERIRDAAHTIWDISEKYETFQISGRGIGYVYASSEEDFLSRCAQSNVEYFDPEALSA